MKQKLLCLVGLHEWHYKPIEGTSNYIRSCLYCPHEEVRAAQHGVHPTGGTHCPECGFPNGKVVTHTCVSHPTASG